MPILKRFRDMIWGPPLEDLIVDLKMYTKEIARTRNKYRQRAEERYERAKEHIIKGDDYRAKMYAKQHLNSDRTAFALDMFVINMDNHIFDLENAQTVNSIGLVMGKISKGLGKLDLMKTRGVSKVMGKVNRQMQRIGLSTERVFSQLEDYEPFSIEPATDKDLNITLDKMVSEVIAEGPAIGLPETRLSELEQKRQAFKTRSSEETK